jgi:dihydroorotate dehydrogenase (NAD+) catalytic subunit
MVEVPGGMMHAIGRENPGVDEVIDRHGAAWRAVPCAIAISLVAADLPSLGKLIARLESRADLVGADAYELDLTVPSDVLGGRRWESSLEESTRCIDAARDSTELPLIVKVSPDVVTPAQFAGAAADAGADLLSVSGSPVGFLPNRTRAASALAEGEGELSGPLIRPRALAAVANAAASGALPIVGGGGIGSPADALDYFAAGADLISLGSALWADSDLPRAVIESARRAAASRGGSRVADLVGTALRRTTTR